MRAIVLDTRWLRGLSFGLSRLRLLASVSIRLVPFVSVNRDVGISPYLGLRIWKASANELARHRFELAPLTRSYTRSNTSGRVHGRRSSTPEGATAEVSTCLNSCLTGV